jgi:cyclopropane-fatty-acyl-phospholipid synthase
MILGKFLARHVRSGLLTVVDAKGRRTELGRIDADTPANEPHVVLRTASEWTELGLALNPGLNAGEAIMDGTLAVERGSIYDFLSLILRNTGLTPPGGAAWYIERALIGLLRRLHQYNPISRSQSNVAHHYDLSKRLYELFLDADMQYSCAYFERPDATLDEAQTAKKRHIATKLCLQPGQRVLDVGCGWGGLALAIARSADVEVLGITLSKEQLEVARARAAAAGLADRVRFELIDYRALDSRFDRIVSVGMFEHVGLPHYGEYFSTLRDRLNDGGIALLHAIGRSDGPGITNAWIRKYIFPGGYAPSLSQVLPHIERSDLFVTDIEILRLHYAETLRHWRERFLANRAEVARLYDERFCRMWEFYLAASECAFRFQGQMVFQILLAKNPVTVPATRDWMYAKTPPPAGA